MCKKTNKKSDKSTNRRIDKQINRQTNSNKKRRHPKTKMKARKNIPQHLETVDLVQTCTSQKCIHILIYFTLAYISLYFTLGYIYFTLPLDTYPLLYPWIHILYFTLGYIYFTLYPWIHILYFIPLDTYPYTLP